MKGFRISECDVSGFVFPNERKWAPKGQNERQWRPKGQNEKKWKPKRRKWKDMNAQKAKMKGNESPKGQYERKCRPTRPKWKENEGPKGQNEGKWKPKRLKNTDFPKCFLRPSPALSGPIPGFSPEFPAAGSENIFPAPGRRWPERAGENPKNHSN